MSYKLVIPQYICWAQVNGGRRYKVLPALTAADAIAQADLLLRTQKDRCPWMADQDPESKLLEVEPYTPDSPYPTHSGHEVWQ